MQEAFGLRQGPAENSSLPTGTARSKAHHTDNVAQTAQALLSRGVTCEFSSQGCLCADTGRNEGARDGGSSSSSFVSLQNRGMRSTSGEE